MSSTTSTGRARALSQLTAAPASRAAATSPSSVNRAASRKLPRPGIRTNQVNGMSVDMATPCHCSASGW